MINELDWVRSLRPPAPAANSEVRAAALEDLETAIATEVASQHPNSDVEYADPSRKLEPSGSVVDFDSKHGVRREHRSRRNLSLRSGWVLPATAAILALVIAGSVLVLVRHGSTGAPGSAGTGPRGSILARNGSVLVKSRTLFDVKIDPAEVPAAGRARAAEYRMLFGPPVSKRPGCASPIGRLTLLGCLLSIRPGHTPGFVTVAADVSGRVAAFIQTRRRELPGVRIVRRYERSYPLGRLAAQLLGIVGPINAAETHEPRYQGLPLSAIVGQSGLEDEYDQYLRAGENLTTTLDARLERVGSESLQHAIDANPRADGGAFVAMNPDNGQIYATGSLPTFNPSIFTKPLSRSAYAHLNSPSTGYPLINRAIQSAGPTGSTFTPITAIAALQSGTWGTNETYNDTGQFCIASTTDCLHNAGHAANGVLDLVNAIRVSDDVFFYNLGALTNINRRTGGPLQQWARAFGIGQHTGIDLPGEMAGTLPSPGSNAARNKLETECENATGPFSGHPKHPAAAGGCGIAPTPPQPWGIGDNVDMAVGQGSLQVTPLQLAVAYAAIANGGTIVTPHLGLTIQTPAGNTIRQINPPPERHLSISPGSRQTILEGLRDAATRPGGTSADVFGGFPEKVYGKTGTAQYISGGVVRDYSWYSSFVPASATSKPIEVVVWVEKGGFGAGAAAPVARQILSQWFLGKPGPYLSGTSTTL